MKRYWYFFKNNCGMRIEVRATSEARAWERLEAYLRRGGMADQPEDITAAGWVMDDGENVVVLP